MVGLLEAGYVVLRYALLVLGVLRLGACVVGARITVRVEGRAWRARGVARRDAPRLRGANGLIGLALCSGGEVDIVGQGQASRGYEQGSGKHHRHDEMFHDVLHKQMGFRVVARNSAAAAPAGILPRGAVCDFR